MSLVEDRIAINRAANQAWVGFWHSCMRDTGGTSCLPLDEAVVEQALNGHDVAPEIIELEPEIELKPEHGLKPRAGDRAGDSSQSPRRSSSRLGSISSASPAGSNRRTAPNRTGPSSWKATAVPAASPCAMY